APRRRAAALRNASRLLGEGKGHRQPRLHGPLQHRGRPHLRLPGARAKPQVLRPDHGAASAGAGTLPEEVGVTAPAIVRLRFRERAAGVSDSASWLGRLMLAPAVLYIALVVGVPFLMAIGYSFSTVTIGTSTPRFVGLENFRNALQDTAFLKALGNTAIFA